MKTTQEYIDDISKSVELLADTTVVLTRARDMQDLYESLSAPKETLERVVTFSEAATDLEVTSDSLSVDGAESVADMCRELADELMNSTDAPLPADRAATTRRTVQEFAQRARNIGAIAWSEYRRSERSSTISDDFLSVIESIDPKTTLRLRSLMAKRRMWGEQELPKAEAMREYRNMGDEIPGLLAGLVGENPEVRQFLESLATGGAGLSMMTEEVASWLETRQLEDGRTLKDLLRIVISAD